MRKNPANSRHKPQSMTNHLLNLGVTLKELREGRNLKREEAAEAIGMTRPFISMVESGERYPRLDTLCKLANLYRYPLSSVFDIMEKKG